jgi:hypothetical protein
MMMHGAHLTRHDIGAAAIVGGRAAERGERRSAAETGDLTSQ